MTATAAPPFEQEKFDAALGRFLGDVGAVMTGALVVAGDRLGLYRALRDGGPQTSSELAAAHQDPRALPARMALEPDRRRVSAVRPRDAALYVAGRTRAVSRRRRERGDGLRTPGGGADDVRGRADDQRSLPHRKGRGVARARSTAVRVHRAHLPARLCCASPEGLDSGARRRRGEVAHRRARRRPGLRPGHLDDPDGEGLPNVSFRRLRLSRGVDRSGAQGRARRRRRRQRRVRNGVGCLVYRQGFRSRLLLSIAFTTWATRWAH